MQAHQRLEQHGLSRAAAADDEVRFSGLEFDRAYKKVCGFDGSIPGYEKRQLEDLDKQTLMQRMQETMEA